MIQTSVHLAAVAVIFEFARRRLGWLAVPLVLPVAVLGSGWDYVLWPVSMGFVASIGLGIAALLMLERDDRRGNLLALACLLVGVVCCEFAAFFAVGIAVETLLRDRRFSRAWVWGIPLAAYTSWWLAYQSGVGASHNLGATPRFAVDLAASGVQGLVGLYAVPRQLLLVAGLVVLVWRIGRARAISPRTAGLLATAGAFWLAVALARAHMATPDATRYVYTSAILLVLLLAEIFRGVSIGRIEVGVAGVFMVLALHGNLGVLHAAEGTLRSATKQVSAELGALEVARATVPAKLAVDPRYAPVLYAGPYFAAVDELGSSPADTPSELLQEPESARVAADRLLVRAGDLRVTSTALGASSFTTALSVAATGGAAVRHGPCVDFHPSQPAAHLDVVLPPDGIDVDIASPTVEIRVRRFAAGFEGAPLTTSGPGVVTSIAPVRDGSSRPWYLRLTPVRSIEVCSRL